MLAQTPSHERSNFFRRPRGVGKTCVVEETGVLLPVGC